MPHEYDPDYDDDQALGDYEMNGPDRLSWSDLQAMENADESDDDGEEDEEGS